MRRPGSTSTSCSPATPTNYAPPARTRRPSGCWGWPRTRRATSSWSCRTRCRPTRRSPPSRGRGRWWGGEPSGPAVAGPAGPIGEQLGDRAQLAQQPVEHLLGGGVDADLGRGALGLDLVDPPRQLFGPRLDPADATVELALGALGPLLHVEAGVLAQGVELAAQRLVLGPGGALLGEHLFDPGADPLDLLVELGAGALGGERDRWLVAPGRWFDRIRHGVHPR